MEPIRIVIADDHQMLREGFKTMLKKQNEVTIVGEAENGSILLEIIKTSKPGIVITDIQMPVMNGIEACRIITEKYPDLGVIALSVYDNDTMIIDALEAGAKGYLLKNTDKEEVLRAIKTVHEGGTYLCENISGNFAKLIAQSKYNPYKVKRKVDFSKRELDIIELTCREMTSKEVADILNISARTVEGCKERMQIKLDAKNMVGVIVYALKNNLINLPKQT